MYQSVASIFDFISYVPDILRESGNLFSIFALVAIIMAVIALLFFRSSKERQKERIFLYTILFLLSLVFASLFAGLSTGFQSGQEVAVADPTLVELSPSATQELESYLRTQGDSVTEQDKSKFLSDVVTNYIATEEANSTSTAALNDTPVNTENEPEPPASANVDADSIPDGFRLEQKSGVVAPILENTILPGCPQLEGGSSVSRHSYPAWLPESSD